MEQLLEVSVGPLLASGVAPAMGGESPPLWADAENVVFASGRVEKVRGYVGLSDLPVRPSYMVAASRQFENVEYIGAGDTYYKWTPGGGLQALGSGFAPGGQWIHVPWGNDLVSTNGVNGLRYYNSAVDALVVTPFANTASIAKWRNQVFAVEYPSIVHYCAVNNPLVWTPSPSNTAGNRTPRDLDGAITSMHPLSQDALAIYTPSSMGRWYYVGGTEIFDFRRTVPGAGAVSHAAVVPVSGEHFSIGQRRVHRVDGASFRYIDDPQVRAYLDRTVNWDRGFEVYGWHDRAYSMVRWVVPVGANAYGGIGYKYDNGSWTRFNDGILIGDASEEGGIWTDTHVATTGRLLRSTSGEINIDTGPLSAFVQTKPFSFGNRELLKQIDKIELDGSWSGTVSVRVGYLQNPNNNNEPIEWDPTLYPIDREVWIDLRQRRSAPFAVIRIESTDVGATWLLERLAIFGEVTEWRN